MLRTAKSSIDLVEPLATKFTIQTAHHFVKGPKKAIYNIFYLIVSSNSEKKNQYLPIFSYISLLKWHWR